MRRNTIRDFWRRVRFGDGCWEYRADSYVDGYGQFTIGGRKHSAHRFAYTQMKGECPAGLLILHECDNRKCCNPEHLRAGTHQENMEDMKSRGRQRSLRGRRHPSRRLTPEKVNRVLKLLEVGESLRSIARLVRLSHVTVLRVKTGKTWIQESSEQNLGHCAPANSGLS